MGQQVVKTLTPHGWMPAIPLPHYGLHKKCRCGKKFLRTKNYEGHYVLAHVYGMERR